MHVLCNYFNGPTKLFANVAEFSDTFAKSFMYIILNIVMQNLFIFETSHLKQYIILQVTIYKILITVCNWRTNGLSSLQWKRIIYSRSSYCIRIPGLEYFALEYFSALSNHGETRIFFRSSIIQQIKKRGRESSRY